MNRFVYLVREISDDLLRLPAAMARYLPDMDARISGERHHGNPNVLRVVVVTRLDEAVADAAFVRFIREFGRDCTPELDPHTLAAAAR